MGIGLDAGGKIFKKSVKYIFLLEFNEPSKGLWRKLLDRAVAWERKWKSEESTGGKKVPQSSQMTPVNWNCFGRNARTAETSHYSLPLFPVNSRQAAHLQPSPSASLREGKEYQV